MVSRGEIWYLMHTALVDRYTQTASIEFASG